jgi:hypothetical protein
MVSAKARAARPQPVGLDWTKRVRHRVHALDAARAGREVAPYVDHLEPADRRGVADLGERSEEKDRDGGRRPGMRAWSPALALSLRPERGDTSEEERAHRQRVARRGPRTSAPRGLDAHHGSPTLVAERPDLVPTRVVQDGGPSVAREHQATPDLGRTEHGVRHVPAADQRQAERSVVAAHDEELCARVHQAAHVVAEQHVVANGQAERTGDGVEHAGLTGRHVALGEGHEPGLRAGAHDAVLGEVHTRDVLAAGLVHHADRDEIRAATPQAALQALACRSHLRVRETRAVLGPHDGPRPAHRGLAGQRLEVTDELASGVHGPRSIGVRPPREVGLYDVHHGDDVVRARAVMGDPGRAQPQRRQRERGPRRAGVTQVQGRRPGRAGEHHGAFRTGGAQP